MNAKKFLMSTAMMSLALAGATHNIPGTSTQRVEPDLKPGPLDYMDTNEFDQARRAKAAAKRARKEAKRLA
ncbi:hypothetical protein [Hymenobacter mucosus]|uniref:Uncharacterized protein n=1 Tax=Hymenobacter mucosus TaxID=1411120 RepID=A0A239A7M4_9BACT|nr:hypothetical protein [Hymenobacter mucosus]SNR91509.1 hypothetical protein SAMN06269173_11136 [Hymenobacter mucosus]